MVWLDEVALKHIRSVINTLQQRIYTYKHKIVYAEVMILLRLLTFFVAVTEQSQNTSILNVLFPQGWTRFYWPLWYEIILKIALPHMI